MKRIASGIMMTLLLIGMLTLASNIQPVKAGPIETIVHEIAWKQQTFYVITTSNSSITPVPMIFDQPQKCLLFNVTGPFGTTGFCNVTIPRELLDAFTDNWQVFVNGTLELISPTSLNATHQFFYITYKHPSNEIKIIGAWAIGAPPTSKTWTVDDDGPADFHTIQEAINVASDGDTIYVYNGTYYEHVIVTKPVKLLGEDRNATIIDGGVRISQWISNVVISGFTIQNGDPGISLSMWSFNHVISNNIITKNGYGITGDYNCFNVTVSDNIITSNYYSGIWLSFSHSIVRNNVISKNGKGIYQNFTSGIDIAEGGNDNMITNNEITNNYMGIHVIYYAEGNIVYHNNFINNTNQVNILLYLNITTFSLDDGYPSGGNYWSNYNGTDFYGGPFQNETGSDGIGDTSYVINVDNIDHYPLMNPYAIPSAEIHDIAVVGIMYSATKVYVGKIVNIRVNVQNQGIFTETFNVTCKYELGGTEHVIGIMTASNLASQASTSIVFSWTTIEVTVYTISAYATILPGETDTADNTMTSLTTVKVKILGDINADGLVNIHDLREAAKAYGATPSSPNWNPQADLYSDGRINIFDLIIIARNYGKTA